MATLNFIPGPDSSSTVARESETQRQLRIQHERELVAKSLADIEAGLGTEWPAVEQWLHDLDSDENAPSPPPMGRSPAS